MAEADHEQLADELEREADKLKRHGDELGEKIDQVRTDWEAKQADPAIPGAVKPEPTGDDAEDTGGSSPSGEEDSTD
jgi:hypothetical protein